MIRQIVQLVILSALLAACGSSHVKMPADNQIPTGANGGVAKVGNPYKIAGKWYTPKAQPNYDEVGIASWYGKQFHGKKTANGEIYNMNALTAAHKTLPLPTNVKVTNLNNGRSIIVRVNDRGPFVGDRVIDLSRRAAQILGFTNQGTTKVRIQALNKNGKVKKNSKKYVKRSRVHDERTQKKSSKHKLSIQVGSFRAKDNAKSRVRELKKAGIKAKITEAFVNGVRYYRVVIATLSDRRRAEGALEQIQAKGFYDARIISK